MKPLFMRLPAGGGLLAAPAAAGQPGGAGQPLVAAPRGQVVAGRALPATARKLVGQLRTAFEPLDTRLGSLGEEAEFAELVARYGPARVIMDAGHGSAPAASKQPPAPG